MMCLFLTVKYVRVLEVNHLYALDVSKDRLKCI